MRQLVMSLGWLLKAVQKTDEAGLYWIQQKHSLQTERHLISGQHTCTPHPFAVKLFAMKKKQGFLYTYLQSKGAQKQADGKPT